MEITQETLIQVGFLPVPDRIHRYQYKGFRGVLVPEIGLFSFDGLTHDIAFMSDLKFLLMLIDHPATKSNWLSPVSYNLKSPAVDDYRAF